MSSWMIVAGFWVVLCLYAMWANKHRALHHKVMHGTSSFLGAFGIGVIVGRVGYWAVNKGREN